jgi:hypothetical protein
MKRWQPTVIGNRRMRCPESFRGSLKRFTLICSVWNASSNRSPHLYDAGFALISIFCVLTICLFGGYVDSTHEQLGSAARHHSPKSR